MDNKRIGENMYNLVSKFKPAGDQPKAIKELTYFITNSGASLKHY